jgi:hypothetical protein
MFTNHTPVKFILLGSLVVVSLIASACSASNAVTTPVVANPTQAPTKALPTAASNPTATAAAAGNSKPANAPAAAPAAKPTAMPTAKPTEKPTVMTTEKPVPATTAAPATSLHIGVAQTAGEVSILPSKDEMVNSLGTNKPKAGDEYLVVTLTIDNQSKTANYDFDPANFKVLDAGGKPIVMATLKSVSNLLSVKLLKPGEKIQGVIVYELPEKDKTVTLEFKNANIPTLIWTIS